MRLGFIVVFVLWLVAMCCAVYGLAKPSATCIGSMWCRETDYTVALNIAIGVLTVLLLGLGAMLKRDN